MIVGFAGYKQVGKDTASTASCFADWHHYALARPLRAVCTAVFGWSAPQMANGSKETVDEFWGVSPRQAMQAIGTELFRERLTSLFPEVGNVWVRRMVLEYERVRDAGQSMVITDVRFPDEARAVQELGGIVIRIDRPGYTAGPHASERKVDEIRADFRIRNDGTVSELHDRVWSTVAHWGSTELVQSR